MDSADTATVTLTISGSGKTTDEDGGSDMRSCFCGYLAV